MFNIKLFRTNYGLSVEINLDINKNLETYLKLLHEEKWEGLNGEEINNRVMNKRSWVICVEVASIWSALIQVYKPN